MNFSSMLTLSNPSQGERYVALAALDCVQSYGIYVDDWLLP